MPRAPPPGFYVLALITLFLWFVVWTRNHDRPVDSLSYSDKFSFNKPFDGKTSGTGNGPVSMPQIVSQGHGEVIAGKIGNETLKAELGRAAWKLFHTTMAQFPDKPTKDQSQALKDYIHLFARLYPCGECAEHFQQIIKRYPPQTSSRSTAAAWACFVHNEVNISKNKPTFDCANIGEWYHCGCSEDEKEKQNHAGAHSEKIANGEDFEIQKEGLTQGG